MVVCVSSDGKYSLRSFQLEMVWMGLDEIGNAMKPK